MRAFFSTPRPETETCNKTFTNTSTQPPLLQLTYNTAFFSADPKLILASSVISAVLAGEKASPTSMSAFKVAMSAFKVVPTHFTGEIRGPIIFFTVGSVVFLA